MLLQSKQIGLSPLRWLEFQDDCIITSCEEGKRPHLHSTITSYDPIHMTWYVG